MRFFVHAPSKGVPPIGAVLTPSMTRTYAGWSSRGKVNGSPGTRGIPVSDPPGIREDVNSLASVGQFSTACAPNMIYPSLYWEADLPQDKERAPVARISDNQMPIPATASAKYYTADPYRARLGGQRQVIQPQVVQRFPGMNSGR
jgi:hypothetical protein